MNDKSVAVIDERAALVPMTFNEEQVQLIKNTVAKGTTNDELALFLYTCKRTGLDPLIKQIYAVKRNTKNGPVMGIQTGIDGYRLIAERTGKYAPGKEPFYKEDGGKLIYATAFVNKLVNGTWHEVAATAYYQEYKNDTNPIWAKMPRAMLSKCAEALALRKAFPAEMAGVYTHEEMEQADVVTVAATEMTTEPTLATTETTTTAQPEYQDGGLADTPVPPEMRPISEKQAKRMFAILHKINKHSEDELKNHLKTTYGIDHARDIPIEKYDEIINWCEGK